MPLRNDLGELLKSSYLPQQQAKEKMAKHGYGYDHDLSSMDTKVFVDRNGKPVIAHRGTTRVADWWDNGLLALGLQKYSKRFQDAKELTKKVQEKYKQSANAVGHSLGGKITEPL